jgi:hypothetical protein
LIDLDPLALVVEIPNPIGAAPIHVNREFDDALGLGQRRIVNVSRDRDGTSPTATPA